jgi:NAD(P)-dependent dehydrogenase (short-subunit alcohol dehydrogenase family)
VVNVASYWAGGLDLGDLELERRRYDNDAAYRQSKQADRMLSVAFAERLRDAGVTANACHPGDVVSTLSRNLGFGGHETPAHTLLRERVPDIRTRRRSLNRRCPGHETAGTDRVNS